MELVNFPFYAIVPTIYSEHTAATLAQISGVLLITRFADVILDPTIGILSDRTRTMVGARKPWLLAGSVILGVGSFFVFRPGPQATATYFLIGSLVWYLGWSMMDVPFVAWGSEVTRDYNERSRVFIFKNVVAIFGVLVFASLPYVTGHASEGFTPSIVALMGLVAAFALPATTIYASVTVPAGLAVSHVRIKFRDLLKGLLRNRPLQFYYGTQIAAGFAIALNGSLIFLYFGDHLQLAYIFPASIIISMLTQIAFSPLAFRFTKQRGKPLIWGSGLILMGATIIAFGFVPAGAAALVPVLTLSAIRGVSLAINNPMGNAVLSDAIDYDILRNRINRAGNLFAVQTLLSKATTAIGGACAFYALSLVQYVPAHANSGHAVTWFIITMAIIPGVILILAGFVAFRFPITFRRQNVIRRRIEQRVSREGVSL